MILKIKDKKAENKNCFSLIFEKPPRFNFYPGQYLDIKLPVSDPNGKTRAFTIASSPTEDFLMIATRLGISPFKKYFFNLKTGDEIESSHPAGTFILDDSSPAIFIAGGIGITPFRSMIKYAVDHGLKTPITLIYSNSDENFLFKKEFDEWQKVYPKLKIIYIVTSRDGRLTQLYPIPYTLYPIYYLAGSPGFVDDMEKILLEAGVDELNIRYDRFDGY